VAVTSATHAPRASRRRPPPLFMIGQDRRGNWVVQDQTGIRGGLFVNRDAALRFVRSENKARPAAIVMVSDALELDLSRAACPPPRPVLVVRLSDHAESPKPTVFCGIGQLAARAEEAFAGATQAIGSLRSGIGTAVWPTDAIDERNSKACSS